MDARRDRSKERCVKFNGSSVNVNVGQFLLRAGRVSLSISYSQYVLRTRRFWLGLLPLLAGLSISPRGRRSEQSNLYHGGQ